MSPFTPIKFGYLAELAVAPEPRCKVGVRTALPSQLRFLKFRSGFMTYGDLLRCKSNLCKSLQTKHSKSLSATHHKIRLHRIQLSPAQYCWVGGRLMSRLLRIASSKIDVAQSGGRRHATRSALICGAVALACFANAAKADEGGVSFWLPGFFGSLAAAPQQPGWSLTSIYYHTSVSAGAEVARAREFETGRIPVNLTATVNASLQARADLGLLMPTYTFATPVFGGQLTVGAIGI